jgi:hypothetical protein
MLKYVDKYGPVHLFVFYSDPERQSQFGGPRWKREYKDLKVSVECGNMVQDFCEEGNELSLSTNVAEFLDHPNEFYIFRTVLLRIILVDKQLDAQFLLCYVYLNPLHVSSNYVLILRRAIVLVQRLVKSLCVTE